MAKKTDLQQIKQKPMPKSPPPSAITYTDLQKRVGTKVSKQKVKDPV